MKILIKVVPVVSGLVGLVAGCVIAYFALALFWTHVVVRPENVTAHDSTIVFTLSVITGMITGIGMLLVSAQRCWSPQARTVHRNVT